MSQRRASKMAFIAGAIGRAVVTGLALYGAKKLYQEYSTTKTEHENCNESIWSPDAGDTESTELPVLPFEQVLKSYYRENVIPESRLYKQQVTVLCHVSEMVETLLTRALPRFKFDRMEIKSHARLGTTGHGHSYTVYLPLVLDANIWQCQSGAQTILPDADGYFLLKRINQQFFKRGSDVMDQFLIGSYMSSGKLFTFIREQCLLIDTEKELRYRLESKISQQIEFNIETESGDFSFALQVVVRSNQSAILATNAEESMWVQCTHDVEDAVLEDTPDATIQALQCLLSCTKHDPLIRQLPIQVFMNIIFTATHLSSNTCQKEVFCSTFVLLSDFLKYFTLPQFFNPFVNLLRFIKQRDCERIALHLDTLSEEGFENLLNAH